MDKFKEIVSLLDSEKEHVIIRNDVKGWFVHYFKIENHEGEYESIYKLYTNNLDMALNDILHIVSNQ